MSRKRKPSKYKNVRISYGYADKKTGRFVSKEYARSHRKSIRRRRFYISKITGNRIRESKISPRRNIQALMELSEGIKTTRVTKKGKVIHRTSHLTLKGAAKQLRTIKSFKGESMDELTAMSGNYDRWFLSIYKKNPNLLPRNVQEYILKENPSLKKIEEDEEEDFEDYW